MNLLGRHRWLFGAMAVMLAAAFIWALSPRNTGPDATHAPALQLAGIQPATLSRGGQSAASVETTTEASARTQLRPARRDPFLNPPLPLPPAPVAYVPPPVVAAPVMASQLPLSLTFTGRMVAPDGQVLVLALWGDGIPVTLSQGKVLSNGYRVERMSANLVELLNPQTQAVVQLPLPPAPRFETR